MGCDLNYGEQLWVADMTHEPSKPLLLALSGEVAVVFATQTGTCKHLAGRLKKQLELNNIRCSLTDVQDLQPSNIEKSSLLIYITSTFYNGE